MIQKADTLCNTQLTHFVIKGKSKNLRFDLELAELILNKFNLIQVKKNEFEFFQDDKFKQSKYLIKSE